MKRFFGIFAFSVLSAFLSNWRKLAAKPGHHRGAAGIDPLNATYMVEGSGVQLIDGRCVGHWKDVYH